MKWKIYSDCISTSNSSDVYIVDAVMRVFTSRGSSTQTTLLERQLKKKSQNNMLEWWF